MPLDQVMLREFDLVTPDTDFLDFQQLLLEKRINALPIMEENDRFLGLITNREIIEAYRMDSIRSEIAPKCAIVINSTKVCYRSDKRYSIRLLDN